MGLSVRLPLRFAAELALLTVLAALAVLVTGCMLGDGYTARDKITNAAREYNDGVRWGRLEIAAEHIPADRRQRFVERHKALEDELEIADYEMTGIELDPQKTRATAHVEYTWTLKRVGLVEKTVTDQVWELTRGVWVVASETRVRGKPLALFDEPPRK
jgi:hypothetical protein